MKRFIIAIALVLCTFVVHADNENAATSKEYVDTELATKQPTIPAAGNDIVMTFDSTATDGIGTKEIYDPAGSYESQTDALVTAGTANAAVQMAINGEFECVLYDPDNPTDCWWWNIKEIATGKNLFDKDDPNMRMAAFFNSDSNYCIVSYSGGDKVVFIPVSPGTTYTVKRVVPNNIYSRFRIGAFNTATVPKQGDCATDVLFETYSLDIYTATVTTKNDTTYLGIFCRNSGAVGDDWQEFLDGFQVEQGTQATSYEPHSITYMPQNQ